MKHDVRLFAFALLSSLCVIEPGGARAETPTVVIKNFNFSPMALTVRAGTNVTWTNLDGEPHTVVSVDGRFRSPALDQSDTYAFRFDQPGTYKYLCSIHPKMMGTVIVTAVQSRR